MYVSPKLRKTATILSLMFYLLAMLSMSSLQTNTNGQQIFISGLNLSRPGTYTHLTISRTSTQGRSEVGRAVFRGGGRGLNERIGSIYLSISNLSFFLTKYGVI